MASAIAETRDAGAPDAAFRALFERQSAYVWHTLRRLGVRDADLEDVTHEVFLLVHRKLAALDPARPVRPWLFGFAYRAAAAYRRLARHRREVPGGSPEVEGPTKTADAQLVEHEQRRLVARALDALEDERRAVLVLHDIDGVAVPEIADALGMPVNTAYSRLRLAREDFARAVRRLRAGGEP